MSKEQIRLSMRRRRRTLSRAAQRKAAEMLTEQVLHLDHFLTNRRIAFYLTNDGEIDPLPLLSLCQAAGKACYLPVLHPLKLNRLHFVRYRYGDRLAINRFGLAEPPLRGHPITAPWSLDLIFLPLVAFDRRGHRLGMGKGFYDRTLDFTRRKPGNSPRLVGLAHSFQEVERIASAPWDISLHAIVTDKELIFCRN